MKKVFVLPPGENWIVDRFVKEWNEDNSDVSVTDPRSADVIWLLADWCWRQLPQHFLRSKKVITSVHHIVPEKFGENDYKDFMERDVLTTAYHVYNESTQEFIRKLTNKPVHQITYWANQKIWRPTGDKYSLRQKYGIPQDSYVIGSFQRDTEGHDLRSPKLEKGPDLLADFIQQLHQKNENIFVVLAGWRRQYIISRLQEAGVRYVYFERPVHETVNELYQCLDIYPVTARTEGGPQALIECGLLNVPVVSRDIGIASQVLPSSSINNDIEHAIAAIPNVDSWKLPIGYDAYRKLIQGL